MSQISPTSSTATDYMSLVPMTRNWEVSSEKIHVVNVIGKGAFGQVAKAMATDLPNLQGNKVVAVKMLKG